DAAVSARLMGGTRAPTLVIDMRAPSEGLPAAVADVKALLLRLPTTVTDADLLRATAAWEHREQEARADPRRRIVELWSAAGARPGGMGASPTGTASPPARGYGGAPHRDWPSLAAWRGFLGATLRETALMIVEARPQ